DTVLRRAPVRGRARRRDAHGLAAGVSGKGNRGDGGLGGKRISLSLPAIRDPDGPTRGHGEELSQAQPDLTSRGTHPRRRQTRRAQAGWAAPSSLRLSIVPVPMPLINEREHALAVEWSCRDRGRFLQKAAVRDA